MSDETPSTGLPEAENAPEITAETPPAESRETTTVSPETERTAVHTETAEDTDAMRAEIAEQRLEDLNDEERPVTSSKKPDEQNEEEEKKGLLGRLLKGGAIGGIGAGIAKFGEFFKKIGEFLGPLRESIARALAPALEAMASNNEAIETAKKWGLGLGTLGIFPGLKLFMGKYADFYKGISRHKITITDEKSSARKFLEIYKKGVADGMNDNFVDFFKLVARETSSAKGDARKVTMEELEGYAKKAVSGMQEKVAEVKTPPAPAASETTTSEPERVG